MGFSPETADSALINCGRHCCICHKFCSFKMELHHILALADGGDDTYDNCIPLCFECHADVRAYDPKHPKGRKYTVSELKGHRDRWYEKVRNSQALTTNPEYIELDRKLFVEIKQILNKDGSIETVRKHDYGGAFKLEWHRGLYDFIYFCQEPECEFLDADMEGLRSRLADDIMKFLHEIGIHTFPLDGNPELNRIQDEPEDDMRFISECHREGISDEEFYARVKRGREFLSNIRSELNNLSQQVWDTYEEFIRSGRRKLGVYLSFSDQ